jgi:hypothetical protein
MGVGLLCALAVPVPERSGGAQSPRGDTARIPAHKQCEFVH